MHFKKSYYNKCARYRLKYSSSNTNVKQFQKKNSYNCMRNVELSCKTALVVNIVGSLSA